MSKKFNLLIRTPLEEIINEEAHELHIDTELGRMVVMPGHSALTASVAFSRIVVKFGDTVRKYFVKNGILFVGRKQNEVNLLCLSCEESSEVTVTTIEDYLKEIKRQVVNKEYKGEYQLQFLKKEEFALKKQVEEMGGKK